MEFDGPGLDQLSLNISTLGVPTTQSRFATCPMAGEKIEPAFKAAIDAGKINGSILCATDAEGRFAYNETLGERTLLSGEKRPHQLDDVLFVASATKFITTVAALQCVEDGLLSLTGDLSSVAPELSKMQVITGFSEDGERPLLEPQTQPITLEMLLTHSSGMAYHFLNPTVGRWRQKFASRPDNPNEDEKLPVEKMMNYPLSFQPGTGWMYGPNLDWAGRIVERLTGKTLCDFMHERIFGPLGITDAEFYPVTREDLRARLVDLNPTDPEALGRAVLGGGGDMNKRTKGDFGGHGLFISAADYLKVLHSILANDEKILKRETVDDMFMHHLSPEATKGHRDALDGPAGIFFRVGVAPGSRAGHGLGGLLTLEDTSGWYGDHTLSWGGGRTCCWFIDRQNNLCGIGAVQSALPLDDKVIESLKQCFRHDVYRKREELMGKQVQ